MRSVDADKPINGSVGQEPLGSFKVGSSDFRAMIGKFTQCYPEGTESSIRPAFRSPRNLPLRTLEKKPVCPHSFRYTPKRILYILDPAATLAIQRSLD